jgi:tetratricopeptide (TPR) repeat protein
MMNAGALCVLRGATRQPVLNIGNCLPHFQSALTEEDTIRSSARFIALVALETDQFPQAMAILLACPSEWQKDPITSYRAALAERILTGHDQDLTRWLGVTQSRCLYYHAARLRAHDHNDKALVAIELAYLLDSDWNSPLDRSFSAFWTGRAFQANQDWDAAVRAYKTALPGFLSETRPIGHEYAAYTFRRLGEVAQQKGNHSEALVYYAQEVLTSPEHANHLRLQQLMQDQGQSLQQVFQVLFELAQQGSQDDPSLWVTSAKILSELGDPTLGLNLLNQAPFSLSNSIAIRDMRAQLLVAQGNEQTASALYYALLEEARQQANREATAVFASALAEVLQTQGEHEAVAALLEEAALRLPTTSIYWCDLGLEYQRQGRLAEAQVVFLEAVLLQPGSVAAVEALSELAR